MIFQKVSICLSVENLPVGPSLTAFVQIYHDPVLCALIFLPLRRIVPFLVVASLPSPLELSFCYPRAACFRGRGWGGGCLFIGRSSGRRLVGKGRI